MGAETHASDELGSRLEPLIREVMRRQRLPGVAVAIVRGGRVAWARGFGVTDLAEPWPVTPETVFHTASITKTFAAGAVLRLAEASRLGLDDPVLRHLPWLRLSDERAAAITVRHLLTHTSGMPDSDPLDFWDAPDFEDGALERYVRSLSGATLIAAPGEKRSYSNDGFEVVGALVANVAGAPFEDAVAGAFLEPLGMRASSVRPRPFDPRTVAAGHVLGDGGEVVRARLYPASRAHAASGTLTSSALDMARWMLANLGGGAVGGVRVLSERRIEEAFRRYVDVEGDAKMAQGLAYRVYEHRGRRAVGHGGWDVGFRCGMTLLPDDGVGAVVLTNFHWGAVTELVQASVDVALGEEPGAPLAEISALPGWTGVYRGDDRSAEVEQRGPDLFLLDPRARRLTPLSPNAFVVSEDKGLDVSYLRRKIEGDEAHFSLTTGKAKLARIS